MKIPALLSLALLLLPLGATAQIYNTGSPNPVPTSTPVVCPNPTTGVVASCATGGGGSGGATAVIVPTGLAANAVTPLSSAAAESCHVFKQAPGNVYGLSGYIGAAGFIFIQNLAAVPINGAIVPYVAPIYVPAAGSWSWTAPTGAPVLFTAGITVCASSTGPLTLTLYSTNTVFSGLFE
jgi:hypothetical protein